MLTTFSYQEFNEEKFVREKGKRVTQKIKQDIENLEKENVKMTKHLQEQEEFIITEENLLRSKILEMHAVMEELAEGQKNTETMMADYWSRVAKSDEVHMNVWKKKREFVSLQEEKCEKMERIRKYEKDLQYELSNYKRLQIDIAKYQAVLERVEAAESQMSRRDHALLPKLSMVNSRLLDDQLRMHDTLKAQYFEYQRRVERPYPIQVIAEDDDIKNSQKQTNDIRIVDRVFGFFFGHHKWFKKPAQQKRSRKPLSPHKTGNLLVDSQFERMAANCKTNAMELVSVQKTYVEINHYLAPYKQLKAYLAKKQKST